MNEIKRTFAGETGVLASVEVKVEAVEEEVEAEEGLEGLSPLLAGLERPRKADRVDCLLIAFSTVDGVGFGMYYSNMSIATSGENVADKATF